MRLIPYDLEAPINKKSHMLLSPKFHSIENFETSISPRNEKKNSTRFKLNEQFFVEHQNFDRKRWNFAIAQKIELKKIKTILVFFFVVEILKKTSERFFFGKMLSIEVSIDWTFRRKSLCELLLIDILRLDLGPSEIKSHYQSDTV